MESDFPKIFTWLQANKLSLNYNKTTFVPTRVDWLTNIEPLNVGLNYQIMENDHIKYLGYIIDRHMRWNLQTKQVITKIRRHNSKLSAWEIVWCLTV